MDVGARWRQVDAEHWVHVWGTGVTALLGLVTAVTTLTGLTAGILGAVLVAAFWGSITCLAGWLTSAWGDERPWAWWVWTIGTAVLFLSGLPGLVAPSWLSVPWLLATGGLLLLLSHPDSRARIDGRRPPAPKPTSVAPPLGWPGQYH